MTTDQISLIFLCAIVTTCNKNTESKRERERETETERERESTCWNYLRYDMKPSINDHNLSVIMDILVEYQLNPEKL